MIFEFKLNRDDGKLVRSLDEAEKQYHARNYADAVAKLGLKSFRSHAVAFCQKRCLVRQMESSPRLGERWAGESGFPPFAEKPS